MVAFCFAVSISDRRCQSYEWRSGTSPLRAGHDAAQLIDSRQHISSCRNDDARYWRIRPEHDIERYECRLSRRHCTFTRSLCVTHVGSPYSITERRVPELIPVLGSQPAGGVSHKPGVRLPLLSARPAVISATLKRAATNFAAW